MSKYSTGEGASSETYIKRNTTQTSLYTRLHHQPTSNLGLPKPYNIGFRPAAYVQVRSIHSFIHSFISAISIAPLQVLYHSEALPTTARILYRSFTPKRTGNCR